jgi:hypothetical protein
VINGTESVRAEAVRLIESPPKTGRIYRRRGVEHQASAPGEAPAADTGTLAGSIITEFDRSELLGTVAATAVYAQALELGTPRIRPRPYMRPALIAKAHIIERDMANAALAALNA